MFVRSTKLLHTKVAQLCKLQRVPSRTFSSTKPSMTVTGPLALLAFPALICTKVGFYFSIAYSAAKIYDARNDNDFSAVGQATDFFTRMITFPLISGTFAFCWPVSIPGYLIYKFLNNIAENVDDDEDLE